MFLPPSVGWQVMSDLQMQQMKGCFAVQLVCNDRCHTELYSLLFKGVFWSSPTAAAPLNACYQLRGAVGKVLIHLSEAQEGNLHYICIHIYILMKHLSFLKIFFLKNKKYWGYFSLNLSNTDSVLRFWNMKEQMGKLLQYIKLDNVKVWESTILIKLKCWKIHKRMRILMNNSDNTSLNENVSASSFAQSLIWSPRAGHEWRKSEMK